MVGSRSHDGVWTAKDDAIFNTERPGCQRRKAVPENGVKLRPRRGRFDISRNRNNGARFLYCTRALSLSVFLGQVWCTVSWAPFVRIAVK
ncbi:hypothetical protein NDU88_006943 [Pleurodeles waltl]|uniref:Uncharacterized protein n=1 Tax=Pleurodeles waltl TaxID=8319 RepID=A0AAV7MFH3_PLEWA|nr:hypothetical protein NDU88_006943 [Pleurodeles waltl]